MFTSDYQKLSVTGLVTLYELDATNIGAGVLRWHGHESFEDWRDIVAWAGREDRNVGNIYESVGAEMIKTDQRTQHTLIWNGATYSPVSIQSVGLEMRSDGKPSTPSLTLANVINGVQGAVSDMCAFNGDFVGAQLKVTHVLARYLDAANFLEGNPTADPMQSTVQYWLIEQKTQETANDVVFELATPLTAQRKRIPARNITRYCEWAVKGKYRGESCGYTGAAMFTEKGEPTNDPSLDKCGARLSDCKLRFGARNPLGFGGFPGSNWNA